MKNLFSKLFITISIIAFNHSKLPAQWYDVFGRNYPDSKHEAGFAADYFISSDAVTVEFQNTYLNDNFIDNDLKDQTFKKMNGEPVLGSGLDAGFFYTRRSERKEGNSWFINVRHRQHYNSTFTPDLFGLYFYGNKMYAGKTADLSDLNYLNIRYNQFQYGVIKKLGKDSSGWTFRGGVSFLLGENYLDIKTDRGSFYTHPEAEFVELDIYLESKQSDSTNTGFGKVNGIGGSVDLGLQYLKEGKYILRFGIRDAGIIAWNNKSTAFEIDTLYRFEGELIENFFDSLFLDIKSEGEFTDGFKENRKEEGFTTMIPLRAEFTYGRFIIPDKLTVWASADYIFNADYTPLIQLWNDYYISGRFMAGISFRYGGYAELGAGLHLAADLGKGFILQAGTSYISGFISSSSATAQGGHIGFRKKF